MNLTIKIILMLVYIISLYFTTFWVIVFLNGEIKFEDKSRVKLKRKPFVSVIVPAYNEESVIEHTLESVTSLDYPKDKLEIIIINDGSTDKTHKIVQDFIKKHKKSNIKLFHQENKGKAAALNHGLSKIEGEFFACLDADSVVEPLTLKKMLGVYEDNKEDLAIVTPAMKVKEPQTILQKLQRLEYILTLFTARLMSCLDCLYVAPGPFSLYRTKIIKELGGFEEGNLTEDMEIAYRVQKQHYSIKHCHDAYVYTNAPRSTKELYLQRNRWFKGGLFNALKYKEITFNKNYGDFGFIQMSINFIAFVLCGSAIFFFLYYLLMPLIKGLHRLYLVNFDFLPYLRSLEFTFDPLSITDLGFIIMFIFIISFGIFYLSHKSAKENVIKKSFWYVIPYFLIYYIILSFIAVVAVFELVVRRKQKW